MEKRKRAGGIEPKPLNHEKAMLLVAMDWDEELDPVEAERLAHHLRRCPECAEEAEKTRDFLDRLKPYLESYPRDEEREK